MILYMYIVICVDLDSSRHRVFVGYLDGKKVALKCYLLDKGHNEFEKMLKELKMLDKHRHPFIVAALGAFKDGKHAYLVMPFLEGGSLSGAKLSQQQIILIMRQVCVCV